MMASDGKVALALPQRVGLDRSRVVYPCSVERYFI